MAITNYDRVTKALALLQEGVYPFLEREMRSHYGSRWLSAAAACLPDNYLGRKQDIQEVLRQDVSALLIVMWEQWSNVFKSVLGRSERSIVSELRDTRNEWAHTTTFSSDDAYRALDSVARLLSAVSAPQAVAEVERHKQELLRVQFEEQARYRSRRAAVIPTEGQPQGGLSPWREVVTPHRDVASGRFQQAEFAADLWQVYLDEGSNEYRDPTEFYGRTYLTEGLKQLLANALRRLSGQGGDPVISLQTNFGGGKTHAMLALYHLANALKIADLPGMESIFQDLGFQEPPQDVNVAVLVGNKLQPSGIVGYKPEHEGQSRPVINTLWGELAWQLGGAEGYELVRKADETSTNPGDALKVLFNRFAPCLILIDEWVAYARQLHDQSDIAGGSFETQFTFAQTLSESAKNADRTLLVVSIPASDISDPHTGQTRSNDIETGGERGKEALERLKNAIGRVESPWRPATGEESFEIVRRRLFQTNTDPNLFAKRDVVVRAFAEMYRNQSQEFPSECKEPDYQQRMKAAYPIHPELFDRLYSDWSSLDKFQRTRGVLCLMAKVIHSLWERNDQSLMIMPAHVAIDDVQVQSQLSRYLEDNWIPVIEKDVDGPNSLPLTLDRQNPNFGRYSACRRVTRTIYMGSAPTLRAANRGLEDRRIKLGCVQPGENPAAFGDALRRLSDQATYIYLDGNRYWVSTQPNVNRTAIERTNQLLEENERYKVEAEIVRRLKKDKSKGEFSAVLIAPESTADIADDANLGVRLVILGPQYPHSRNNPESKGQKWAEDALHHKGNSPRFYKNTLLFLAADSNKIENLARNVAQYLAWEAIVEDKKILNLDAFQEKQAMNKKEQSDKDVGVILLDTYQWLLVPTQELRREERGERKEERGKRGEERGESKAEGEDSKAENSLSPLSSIISPIEWKETRLQVQGYLVETASKKAEYESNLLTTYGPNLLRLEVLDEILWRDRNHLDLSSLWEYLTRYLYLPRLKDRSVLLECIQKGVSVINWADNFAFATGFDEVKGEYIGLQFGTGINPSISPNSLIVKPEVAQRQINAAQAAKASNSPSISKFAEKGGAYQTSVTSEKNDNNNDSIKSPEKQPPRRFHGSVEIDPMRINRDVGAIANEIIQHLTALTGAEVKITLEISADIPEGAPDNIVRTVTENCLTLKFKHQSFESE